MLAARACRLRWPALEGAHRCYAAAASNLQLIKALREKSGAPMAEVKAALEEATWDEGMQLRRFECPYVQLELFSKYSWVQKAPTRP